MSSTWRAGNKGGRTDPKHLTATEPELLLSEVHRYMTKRIVYQAKPGKGYTIRRNSKVIGKTIESHYRITFLLYRAHSAPN
jgi:hypothetical protein